MVTLRFRERFFPRLSLVSFQSTLHLSIGSKGNGKHSMRRLAKWSEVDLKRALARMQAAH